jgi:hypothetical protein
VSFSISSRFLLTWSPYSQFSGIRRLTTSSARQETAAEVNGHTFFGHFSSLFKRIYHNSSHTTSQPHPLDQHRNTAKIHIRDCEGIGLQERRLTAVDVPFAQGYRVSPTFSPFSDIRFHMYHTEERFGERGTDEERERKEREEGFCR